MTPEQKKYLVFAIAAAAVVVLISLYSAYSAKENYISRFKPAPEAAPDMSQLAKKSLGYLNDTYTGKTASGDHLNRFSLKNSQSRPTPPRRITSSGVEAYAAPSYGLLPYPAEY